MMRKQFSLKKRKVKKAVDKVYQRMHKHNVFQSVLYNEVPKDTIRKIIYQWV